MKSALGTFVFTIGLALISAVAEGSLLSKNYVNIRSITEENINITSLSGTAGSSSSWSIARTSTECAARCAVNSQCTIFRFQGRDENGDTSLCRIGPNMGSSGELLLEDRWDTFLQAELLAGQACLASQQCGEPQGSPLPMTCDPVTQRCTCFNASSFERPATTSLDLKTCIPGSGPDNLGFRHLWDGFSYIRLPQTGLLSRSQARAKCQAINSVLPEPSPANGVNFQTLAAFMGPNDVFHLGYSVTESGTGRQYFSDSTNASVALESSSVWPTFSVLAGPSGNLRSVLMSRTGLQIAPDEVEIITCVICWKRTGYLFLNLTGMYYKAYNLSKSQYDAEKVCQSDGGRLAVTNKGYGKSLIGHFQNVLRVQEFWVGGTDEAEEGTWVFPDGTTMKKFNRYTPSVPAGLDGYWYSTDPNGGTGDNCIRPVAQMVWRDIACSNSFPFLCERIF